MLAASEMPRARTVGYCGRFASGRCCALCGALLIRRSFESDLDDDETAGFRRAGTNLDARDRPQRTQPLILLSGFSERLKHAGLRCGGAGAIRSRRCVHSEAEPMTDDRPQMGQLLWAAKVVATPPS